MTFTIVIMMMLMSVMTTTTMMTMMSVLTSTDMITAELACVIADCTLGKTPAGRANRGQAKMKMMVRMMHQIQILRSALFSASMVSSLAIAFFCSTHSRAHVSP